MTLTARVLILTVAMALPVVCFAADQQKIAVVDMESLVKAHPDTKSAESLLQKQVDEFEAEQKDRMDELEKLKKTFEDSRKEAENKALSESERDKKLAAAEDKLNDLRDHDRQLRDMTSKRQKEIADQGLRMRRRIVAKIRDIVKEYAEKKGYSIVIDSSALSMGGIETIAYSSDKNDITADVRKLVEQQKKDASGE